jgi:hypothetical protein
VNLLYSDRSYQRDKKGKVLKVRGL